VSLSNTQPSTCDTKENIIAKLGSSQGICGGASCSALTGCKYQQYLSIIQKESARQGVDQKLVIATLCAESKGNNSLAPNKNPNGTYDCGLMQINQPGACDSSSLDPATNIEAGVRHLKQTTASANQVYPNIPQVASIAAAYNSGPAYNKPSADCTAQAGFSFTPPKWVCPINPGDGKYNMCAVKSYACGISACVEQLRAQGL
jgi:soluble lytic murein transglycosylase-like protein